MAEPTHWAFPHGLQPKASEVSFDLAAAFDAVVFLHAAIPEDAFTAPILGSERTGNGIVIREDGLVLTIGYLIVEAESIWLTANDGTVVAGHPLAYDFVTGFGLIQPLGRLDLPPLAVGTAASLAVGDEVIVLGHGGRAHALKADVFAKHEFAGPWEYVLDQALFTSPPHPEWSGAALLGADGRLAGVGSLFVQESVGDDTVKGNMFVPIDVLAPVQDDMLQLGRRSGPARPWLGMYTTETPDGLVVTGLAPDGPAERGGVHQGDVVADVAGSRPDSLADFYRKVWRRGPAGAVIPLTLLRAGDAVRVDVASTDRDDRLRKPRMQ
jgi:S1-C subfamily serine protease